MLTGAKHNAATNNPSENISMKNRKRLLIAVDDSEASQRAVDYVSAMIDGRSGRIAREGLAKLLIEVISGHVGRSIRRAPLFT